MAKEKLPNMEDSGSSASESHRVEEKTRSEGEEEINHQEREKKNREEEQEENLNQRKEEKSEDSDDEETIREDEEVNQEEVEEVKRQIMEKKNREKEQEENLIEREEKKSEDSDDEEQPMQPQGMFFGPREYTKTCKVGTRCQVYHTVELLKEFKEDLPWFEAHSQFRHVFHMPQEKHHMTQGLWMLLLRTTRIETDR